MNKSGLITLVLPFLLCLPCLLVLLGVVGGVALATAAVAWLAGNAAIAVVAGGAIALGAALVINRKRGAACEVDAGELEERRTRRW